MSDKKVNRLNLFDEEQTDYLFQYDQYRKLLEPIESIIPIIKAQIELTNKSGGKSKTTMLKILDSILKTYKGITDNIVKLHYGNLEFVLELIKITYGDIKLPSIPEMIIQNQTPKTESPQQTQENQPTPEVTEAQPVEPSVEEQNENLDNIEFIDMDQNDHPV